MSRRSAHEELEPVAVSYGEWGGEVRPGRVSAKTPGIAERIDAITRFLPVFERTGEPGAWAGGDQDAEGVFTLPWFNYSDDAHAFIQALYENGWIENFDWPSWHPTAIRYVENPALLSRATIETLRRLLTTHVRKDRFVEGHFAEMAGEGHIAAILLRLSDIRNSLP